MAEGKGAAVSLIGMTGACGFSILGTEETFGEGAAAFLAVLFFAAVFLAVVFFAVVFLAVLFFAVLFLAATVFLFAVVLDLAVVLFFGFAAVFFRVVLLAVFLVAFLAVLVAAFFFFTPLFIDLTPSRVFRQVTDCKRDKIPPQELQYSQKGVK